MEHGWTLRKFAHAEVGPRSGKGCYWDEHALIHPECGRIIEAKHWEWAEIDGKRLTWVVGGKLHAGRVRRDGIQDEKVLYDFNKMSFEAIAAPY